MSAISRAREHACRPLCANDAFFSYLAARAKPVLILASKEHFGAGGIIRYVSKVVRKPETNKEYTVWGLEVTD